MVRTIWNQAYNFPLGFLGKNWFTSSAFTSPLGSFVYSDIVDNVIYYFDAL